LVPDTGEPVDLVGRPHRLAAWRADDTGATTAEYAIGVLAAAGFAGLLVTLLTSDTARGWLETIISRALSL
jgi:hypothetical protein